MDGIFELGYQVGSVSFQVSKGEVLGTKNLVSNLKKIFKIFDKSDALLKTKFNTLPYSM